MGEDDHKGSRPPHLRLLLPEESREDEELVPLARQGDLAALSLLYQRHGGALWGFLMAFHLPLHAATAVATQAFSESLLASEPGWSFPGLLFRSAWEMCLPQLQEEVPLPISPASGGGSDEGGTSMLLGPSGGVWLASQLPTLPRHERAAILLYYKVGLRLKEMAVILGGSEADAMDVLAKARTQLRMLIGEGRNHAHSGQQ